MRDLMIRVRRHSVDFLLTCKDPKSKERSLLQQLEEDNRLSELNSAAEGNNEVNLNPFSLNSTKSGHRKTGRAGSSTGLDGKSVRVVGGLRTSSRIRSMDQTTRHQTASTTTVYKTVDLEKSCSAIQETIVKESQSSDIIHAAQSSAEHKTTGASPPLEVCISDGSKNVVDNRVISLKQYLTVNLTRLSVPQREQAGKTSEDKRGRVEVQGRSRQSQRLRPLGQAVQSETTVSGGQQGEGGKPEICIAEANREMFFKAIDQENVGTREESEKQANDEVIKIQTVSGAESGCTLEEQQKIVEEQTASAVESSVNRGGEECKTSPSEKPVWQSKSRCVKSKVQEDVACCKQPVTTPEGDVVLKQVTVLLCDILRKGTSLIDGRLQGDVPTCCLQQAAQEIEKHGGRCHRSAQRRNVGRRTMRPRAAKTRVEDEQTNRGSTEGPAACKTDVIKDGVQLLSTEERDDPQAACLNTLPPKSSASARAVTPLHSDVSPQALTQSNIPLKKRTFRSSVQIDPGQGLTSAPGQTVTELNPSADVEQDVFSEEQSGDKRGRLMNDKVKKFTCRRITRQSHVNGAVPPRGSEVQRSNLMRHVRKCKLERRDEDPAKVQERCKRQITVNNCLTEGDGEIFPLQQSDSEDVKPDLNFKIRFKRRRGKVWEMQNAGMEHMMLKTEQRDELESCDPFKAIMDSVSVLNMEMQAAQAHVQASKKSKGRLHRLKRRGERRSDRRLSTDDENAENAPGKVSDEMLDGEIVVEVKPLPEKIDNHKIEALPAAARETKVEDRFLKNCCLFERRQKHEQVLDSNGVPVPTIKLRRKTEDIWVVDSNDEEHKHSELKVEPKIKKEIRSHVLVKQKKGALDLSKLKEEVPPSQRLNAAPLKTEPPHFSLSLSPLSLSSPLNDTPEVISTAANVIIERPEMNSGGRKQRHKMERAHKCGPVETPTTCLSHTLQQIDNSLSRLEGLCSSQTLEKTAACSNASNSVIQPPSQSPPPFTATDNMLSGEPTFPNCCDDLLDFQCLNFEGYYQPQNMLPSSPSDLCSLDPPTDPFSSPLSHSPSDTWATETPYLGPPSPGDNFTSEDLQFFPGLISSKSDSVSVECEAKEPPKDRNPPMHSFSDLCNSDLTAKDRILSRNQGLRMSKEDPRTQPMSSVFGKPRFFGPTSSVISQSPVTLGQPHISVRASSCHPRPQSTFKSQGPFHRMTVPSKPQSFSNCPPNTVRGVPQSCLNKSVPPSQMANKFLSPQLFTMKHPPDNTFSFHEKPSTVIHRVLKFQGGNQSQNLYSAPCKDAMTAGGPTVTSKTLGARSMERSEHGQKVCDGHHHHHHHHHKGNISVQEFGKDVGYLGSSHHPGRPNPHFHKPNAPFPQLFNRSKMPSDKHEGETMYKNFSTLPRQFFFPSKMSEGYFHPQDKNLKHDKPPPVNSDKHQSCYAQQDPFDFSFQQSLSQMPQHHTPHVVHSTAAGTPAPANKGQTSASFSYDAQGPPYVLNFSGDHSLTLGLRDGVEGYPGRGSTNYTYHCLMEPSGTQGRLVLEPCGSQQPSFSLGGFSGLKGQDDHCKKDMQQQSQPGEHQGAPHYGPATSHSMGPTKPKRVRLVVTDGTVDLDLQYSD